MNNSTLIHSGAAAVDITPAAPTFLSGYPHVQRQSTGVSDPLLASALYISDGETRVIFIANDIIFVPKWLSDRARKRIEASTGVPADHVMITATHTHSGPVTTKMLSNETDPIVPEPDPGYLTLLECGIVAAAERACAGAKPAEIGHVLADGSGLGSNRHDPEGVRDPRVSVLSVRSVEGDDCIGLMLVCNMHPTVLHEDSTLISGDFPGFARRYLQENVIGADCPVVYHMGAAGNQSPRHVTKSNTIEEANRLGELLGKAVADVLPSLSYERSLDVSCDSVLLELPLRGFPPVTEAAAARDKAKQRFEHLRDTRAPRADTRSAECDWFGSEETVTLSRAAQSGRLEQAARACMPARVQVIRVGPWAFVGWPGEVYVEFALDVKKRFPDCCVVTLANSDLEGYIVTQEAVDRASYESGNAVFKSPDSGEMLVEATIDLLSRSGQ
ncbi:MAG: neutral/alkaline non-lysosomal ceramidase N-terminal domain-containing protein [Phycisphaerales bacterium]